MEAANEFLRKHYIAEFNSKFKVVPAVKETAFRRNTRADLDWVFTVQSERVVAKDNTVAIAERNWQLEKSRFRSSLAGCRVTIHEHLNGTVSVRYGPHVVGQYLADGTAEPVNKKTSKGRGKAGPVEAMENQKPVSHCSHRPLEIPKGRDSHFSTAPAAIPTFPKKQSRKPPSASRRGTANQIT